jgi:hypothetical protein
VTAHHVSSRGRAPRLEPPRSLVSVFLEAMPRRWPVIALAISSVVTAHWPTGGWSARSTAAPPQNPIFSITSELVFEDNAPLEALTRAIRARGRTALYDAIEQGIDYLAKGSHVRRVLVIVSDGGDNASHLTFEQVLRNTLTSNVVIYTVGLIDEIDDQADPKRLKQLAEETGGEAFRPRDSYTLGYAPTDTERSGTFRRIRITAKSPTGEPLVVRTRTGVLAGPSR